jgi:putative ABC transport system ATP-binding protein
MGSTVALEGVSKSYGRNGASSAAVAEVCLEIAAGEFLAIMGPSGSGKSTLLNLIAGIDVPSRGRVIIDGHDLSALSDDDRSDFRLRHLGFVFQSFNLLPMFTAEENVTWPLEVLGVSSRTARQRAASVFDQLAISAEARRRRPAELSGGEQQRVAIARALIAEPHLLLADEPTGNLDSANGAAILDLLSQLSRERGVTILLVTHNATAAAAAERIIELRDGRLFESQ